MKILLLILLTPITLLGQFASRERRINPYESKEENTYKEKNKYEPFRPQTIEEVKGHTLKHLKLLLIEDNGKQDVNESNLNKMERDLNFLDLNNIANGSKNRNTLLSYSNSKGTIANLYLDSEYDEFMWGEPGYWINLENKNGLHDYYTGLAQNYYLKLLDTGTNIWKNDSTLQINAVRVRLIQPFMHPVSAPKYETIDNVKVEISIADLIRDSDKDGLSDIEEDKLMLNPFSKDTDGDGIVDMDDHNPRFKSVTTNETLVYKAILDNYINDTIKIRDSRIVNPKRPSLIHTLKSRTRLIVTDDVNLQKVDLDYDRTIILTKNEYLAHKLKYPVTLDETNVTPLFKVDKMNDAFIISEYRDLGGEKYLVKKLRNGGFDIREIESWIR